MCLFWRRQLNLLSASVVVIHGIYGISVKCPHWKGRVFLYEGENAGEYVSTKL